MITLYVILGGSFVFGIWLFLLLAMPQEPVHVIVVTPTVASVAATVTPEAQ